MSKSYNNTIALSDSPEEVTKKVMSMITDPARIRKTDPGHPEVCNVFTYHKLFSEDEVTEIEADCRKGEIGCVACKRKLAANIGKMMTPIYEKRQKWVGRSEDLKDIIRAGNKKAQERAGKTMESVRSAMHVDWL